MKTVTIRIEQMYPNRKLIEEFNWNDMDRTTQQLTIEVERYINQQMNVYRHKFPEMTELRWEYVHIGQGHYVMISDKPLSVFVGKLTYIQCLDVLHKAIELNDWLMVENIGYALRLMGNIQLETFADFELSYAVYEFDWMFDDDADIELDDDVEMYDSQKWTVVAKENYVNTRGVHLLTKGKYYTLAVDEESWDATIRYENGNTQIVGQIVAGNFEPTYIFESILELV